ncbi:NAD(P)/FAD-dependent oxidoreductase [Microbispora triticiradicis]|uniref:FAD-dependent oxidoreductase n=2 Tax=Microbispora TaxID=2005 RepID=A0ABY3LQ95_9ACTN|nr:MULTISPECIES: FAD-dependent oxidoreductase [Microbispora]TLP58910.1 FAD-dependent oxidoreductase [Microbispora fusca]TYB47246.1 FAD-dependent oxidoreductase [Microbispora tritici]
MIEDAAPRVFWTDRPGAPGPYEPLHGRTTADLLVVGGGFTGLWAAVLAKQENPACDVVLVEARSVAYGASGRNGGFVADSLTHGIGHGARLWPAENAALLALGRANLAAIARFVDDHGIDADLRLVGKTTVAVAPHQVEELRRAEKLHREHGEDAVFLGRDEMRADVDSPTYLAGLRLRGTGGLLDPAGLAWGLARVAARLGVRVHEGTEVTALTRTRTGVEARTGGRAVVHAGQVLLATNAFPSPLRRLGLFMLPVWDYVLVTEPLSAEQRASIRWPEGQGLTDAGNQFHYYRLTRDDRVLWGGYDAIYNFGGGGSEQRDASHERLARHFFATFPQLRGLRFTHRWGGVIDSTSRFTPFFGTAMGGRLAYALGYTGLGVGASRFGALVGLDLLAGRSTARTRPRMVRRHPVPFPPEPLRWPVVELTRRALARADDNEGRRGPWLRVLDHLGIGFDS